MKNLKKISKPKHLFRFALAIVFLLTFSITTGCEKKHDKGKGKKKGYKKMSVKFTPEIPVDVNPIVQDSLKNAKDIYSLNEKFNEFSWQAFIAIHWPRDKEGNPTPNFWDEGTPTWLGWKEAFQVYRKDGSKPAPWGSPRTASGLGLSPEILEDKKVRAVLSSKTPTHPGNFNVANEVDQAFAGKLFDQNGNVVVYEVLMNEAEFDYVVNNSLYNINGQVEFSKTHTEANFPIGNYSTKQEGAVEIKFAWKILEDSDIKERYYSEEGYILGPNDELVKKDLGMIGFHISQKTPTGKQWVWSTFEHIDNLDQNVVKKDGKRTIIHPTLRDPECEICPANVDVTNGGTTYTYETSKSGDYWKISGDTTKYYAESKIMKTQAHRMVDIPVRVQRINKKMQAYFKSKNSVWQYYQLIDTQYPLNQDAAPAPHTAENNSVPASVVNKPGGDPNLALLTNITMETFFQAGNEAGSNLMENNPPNNIQIFGTESCMGCHSSAGIYQAYDPVNKKSKQGGQLTGDFSWLLLTANWEETKK